MFFFSFFQLAEMGSHITGLKRDKRSYFGEHIFLLDGWSLNFHLEILFCDGQSSSIQLLQHPTPI